MPVTQFPDPEQAPADGLLAIGGDLSPENLLSAYRAGIFPWPLGNPRSPMTWFSPDPRAILEFNRLHVPRSLERIRKKGGFQFTLDQDFESVIRACSKVQRPGQQGSWITPPMREAYLALHQRGHAHSVEAWEIAPGQPPHLVGGVYGVDAGGIFAGESMFHLRPNASKLALLHLIEHLACRGADWMDIQILTPHMEALGAREIPRQEFLKRLRDGLGSFLENEPPHPSKRLF